MILQDHYDDERNKTMFHNTRPGWPRSRPRPIFWSHTGLVLRPTVSDHISGKDIPAWSSTSDIQSRRGKVGRLSKRQFDRFASAICSCTVLLNFNKSHS